MTDLEDRIRNALADRAEHTVVRRISVGQGESPDPAVFRLDAQPASRRTGGDRAVSARGVLAVVAASVVVVAGLVAVVWLNDPPQAPSEQPTPTPTAPSPFAIDISDRLSISLDGLAASDADRGGDRTFLALDEAELPLGVEVASEGGALYSFGPASNEYGYSYSALVTIDGDEFYLRVAENLEGSTFGFAPYCAAQYLPVDASVGEVVPSMDRTAVCILHSDRYTISLVPSPSSPSADLDRQIDTGLELAEQLRFVELEDVPLTDPTTRTGEGEPDEVAFVGSLSGARWAATVAPNELRAMFTYIDGAQSGGFEHDRSSQPTDEVVDHVETSVDATPGYGVIIYGFAPPQASQVIVSTDQNQLARLPLQQRELESFFAVPVPDALVVTSLRLVDDDGNTVATIDVPAFPPGLGGGYGGLLVAD